MTESTKVRLVRCPKCENLLPEIADYSTYQCGGCGAVLPAKIRNREPGKSEEDRLGRISTKSQILPDKDIVDSSDTSVADGKSNVGSLRCDERDTDIDCTHISRKELKIAADTCSVVKGNKISMDKDKIASLMGREHEDSNSSFGHASGSQRRGQISDWHAGKQEEMDGFLRIPRTVAEDVRFSTSKNSDEGPSNGHLDSSYGYRESLQAQTDQDGSGRILLEEDRAMLLRKLDELKEQLSRSCVVIDKPKEKVPVDRMVAPPESYVGADSWFPNGSSGSQKPPLPFYELNKHAARADPSYFSHFPEPFAYPVGNEMTRHGLYPPLHNPNYASAFGPQVLGRTSHQLPGAYQQQPPHPYFPRENIEGNHDPFMPYPQSSVLHHASCSCFHCYEKHQQVPAPVPPSAFGNKRFPDMPSNPMYRIENPGTFGSRTAMPPPLDVHGTQAHARLPEDTSSKIGGFVWGRPQRMVLARGGRHVCPIAGGAPFLTCYNCFELLQIPRKMQLVVKNEYKFRCGACSIVINFNITNKSHVLHDYAKMKGISMEADDISNEVVNDCSSHFHGHKNRISANFSSADYDHSGYEFQSMDREPVALPTDQALNSVGPQEMQSIHSSSPSISEDENSPYILLASREEVNSVQQPIKSILPPPPAGSPLQEHFDYSTNNLAVNRFGKGNHSSQSDQENILSSKATTRQSCFNEASLPTEMEVPSNEYSNTGISQDSGDATREYDQLKMAKGGETCLANIVNKNFKDSSKFNQTEEHGESNVSVNGHPLPERVVKKAEKMAGPVRPGNYWYDFRSGFWGVMGGPCLGIIHPFIEEFNYPMPENCAGGRTGVFVNGRELHQKDLGVLASRGLPTDRDRFYIIEISGKVLDEDTGEELHRLGKLAPTVEKAKRGFGMKVPRAAAQ
ncbi:hypothetical protein like AT3G61670 [Hibiscus trionum]|uniref:Zinc-ribbon domain-containing protein n=1 Tax=Hibiscus trionum TaxID=183268 RepID=A0A9W7IVY3_HIBTR|nr:hypothetical protein like AT3G61670 [Hibiscus trionum]